MRNERTFHADAMGGSGATSPSVAPVAPQEAPVAAFAPGATAGEKMADVARNHGWKIGAAIGSAAIAAALLYSRRRD